jgi:DNA-binding CsgD family transcriptional regulator
VHVSADGRISFASGTAIFAVDQDLQIVGWNEAAERLTGISAAEAAGRPCWDVIRGLDADGNLVCHKGCSRARIVREGHCLPATELVARLPAGSLPLALETIAVTGDGRPLFLHVMRPAPAQPNGRHDEPPSPAPQLTRRQAEILGLLAEGKSAAAIAAGLDLRLSTVRNHISALLRELDAHSQLEAVARARALALL